MTIFCPIIRNAKFLPDQANFQARKPLPSLSSREALKKPLDHQVAESAFTKLHTRLQLQRNVVASGPESSVYGLQASGLGKEPFESGPVKLEASYVLVYG